MKVLSAFAAGLLFTTGLALAGMTQPEKVLGFLDVTGHWDPSLALVMGGAIAVHLGARRLLARRDRPLFAAAFSTPTKTRLDAPLVLGSALFGAGWGLSGYCPGPALASSVVSGRPALVFIAAMVAGMAAWELWLRLRSTVASAQELASSDGEVASASASASAVEPDPT